MASKKDLVFATLLFCLSCSMSIRGQDPSKHLVIQTDAKLGFTQGRQAIKSGGNSSSAGSIKAEQKTYVHYAGYQSTGFHGGQPWHGVRASITLWEIPDVQPLSSSGAYIAAINKGTGQEFIAAGAHVHPGLYNNTDVHFFAYWTTTIDHSTGCYNTGCPGFVIANGSNLLPGQPIASPLSTYGGIQKGITIRIKRDEHTGDWSLYREDQGGPIGGMTLLGWWPGSLFAYLSEFAEIILWAGGITHNYNEKSPPMGSGHFSSELDGKAASFHDCFGFDENGYVYEDPYDADPYQDRPDCYDVSEWYETKRSAKRHFFFGGPGGCTE